MEILATTTTIYFLSGVLIFCIFFLIFVLFYKVEESDEQTTSKSKAAAKKIPKKQNIFEQAAVASTTEICTNIVTEIFKKGGSVADASITALLCEGICSPQSMGVGGGFLLTYYEKSVRKAYVLNARECAPENTKPDMYRSLSSPASGGLAVAVPGEILGYWDLHRRFGKLPWKDLFEPVIKMCREGFVLNKFAAQSFANMRSYIMNSPTLKEIFVNPTTGDVFKPGEKMTRPQLADTFEVIANEGPQALYDGKLTDAFIKDIEDNGGIITKSDMKNYRTNWTNPVQMQLPGHNTIYSVPSPGSGSVLLMILDVLFGLGKTDDPGMNWFRIVETWKHAFGFRSNLDGPLITDTSVDCEYDPSFAKSTMNKIATEEKTSEDVRHYTTEYEKVYHEGGTCHISLIAPNGDAISVTSSINYALGAMFASKSTGMIMNNQMMDFAIPEYHDKYYKYNQIAPNKQPVSCMIPTIVIDRRSGDVRLVVGSAGGFKIISSTSQLILETLLYDVPVEEAIIHPRLHHQLVPMVLFYENDFPPDVLAQLRKYGHHLEKIKPATSGAIISVTKDGIEAVGDPRRFGSSGGI